MPGPPDAVTVKLDERPPMVFADPGHALTGPETTLFVNSLVAGFHPHR
jgi:hypothetical protein